MTVGSAIADGDVNLLREGVRVLVLGAAAAGLSERPAVGPGTLRWKGVRRMAGVTASVTATWTLG